ncbi:MAG TPA: EAL domain-containing protein [Steroidobacteraceae bacterium]|nr:EAL domain-containing protein [Steroidobacteraceae bacterium]
MSSVRRSRILCVDDEPQVLDSLALNLRRHHEVLTATSGAAALELLEHEQQIAVILSDMRMPGMDGAAFLARSRQLAPDARRILLTGQTDLAAAINAVNEGRIFRFLSKPCAPPQILAAIQAAIEDRQQDLREHSAIRRTAEQRIEGCDPLTGLASRDGLLRTLAATASADDPEATPFLTLFFLGVDTSDNLGAASDPGWADKLQQAIARHLQGLFPEAACLARWATDQFVVATPDGTVDGDGLAESGAQLITQLGESLQVEYTALQISLGVGAARWPFDSEQPRTVVGYAEMAMREARRKGPNSCCVYRHEWRDKLQHRLKLLSALRKTIDNDLMHLHYQPIVDVEGMQVRSLECLARWEDARLGNVPPGTFISLAEESGLMPPLGQMILRRACVEGRTLMGRQCPLLAVNVSVLQLLRPDYLAQLDATLEACHFDPHGLELEITESVFAQEAERVVAVLNELRARGIHIAIDDFGTGYSSLAYLQQFPVTSLKVDRAFVQSLATGGDSIIAAALSIGRSRGIDIIIEGVETSAMLQQVRQLGATLVQGYLIARPMSAAACSGWLQQLGENGLARAHA